MIEVKMARNLTRDGVEGLRWVLLDPPDTVPMPLAPAPIDPRLYQLAGRASADEAPDTTAGTAQPLATATADERPAPGARISAPAPASAPRAGSRPRTGPGPDRRSTPRQTAMLGLLKTLVVLLALGAAVATAWRVIGPPRMPGDGLGPAARPASGVRPPVTVRTVTARLAPQPGRQTDQEAVR